MLTTREIKAGEVVAALALRVLAGGSNLEQQIRGGYASDMLSCVMAEAKTGYRLGDHAGAPERGGRGLPS